MCELLGMSANVPTDICFSLSELIKHGGECGPHRDGWGISFYEGQGCRSFHDAMPGSDSFVGQMLQTYPIKSHIVVSHIRQANRGRVCLENTHPFIRELWGRYWTFAHNGQLKGIKKQPLKFYHPVGSTDSEYAFCWLLDQLRQQFNVRPKNPKTVWTFIEKCFAELRAMGVFNALMSDSQVLYSTCSTQLCAITRKAPFGRATLIHSGIEIDFSAVTTLSDVVTVISTEKLTSEADWTCMQPGEFRVYNNGICIYEAIQ
ncbi:MAG: class II glutamine amidotransferase [Methylococcales bacterium]|jgi:predicted glutamine amidotransferase|nr:class II glutamine amidotransferase [Methylococcales bacterium]